MALFQTHNWEKSSFFSTLVRVFAQLYVTGFNRVKAKWKQKRKSIKLLQQSRYFNAEALEKDSSDAFNVTEVTFHTV